jgi:hypothetical protein
MSQAPTTAPRKPSRYWAAMKLILFFPLYAAALLIVAGLSLLVILLLWDSDALRVVEIERYWLQNFSDMPGVKGYATELLRHDSLGLRNLIMLGEALAAITPFILLGMGIQCIRRKTTDLALNPIFCWFYSAWLLLCVAIIDKGLYP